MDIFSPYIQGRVVIEVVIFSGLYPVNKPKKFTAVFNYWQAGAIDEGRLSFSVCQRSRLYIYRFPEAKAQHYIATT